MSTEYINTEYVNPEYTDTEYIDLEPTPKKMNFHTLGAILTFIFMPPLWCLSVPAICYASEAKKFAALGDTALAHSFADKALRFIKATWLSAAILAAAGFLFLIICAARLV